MTVSGLLVLTLLALSTGFSSSFTPWLLADEGETEPRDVQKNQCEKCDEKSCPKLLYCVAVVVKDHCGCCNVCSTDVYTPNLRPNSPTKRVSPCDSVTCPKYKICMENMQGLPLCTCPSVYSCRRRKKEVCGTDNVTYHSRCHLRIAACKLGKRLKVNHKEACTEDEILAGEQKLPKRRPHKRKEKRRRKKTKHHKNVSPDKMTNFNERELGRQRDSTEVTGKRERKKHRRQKRRKRNKRRKRMQYKSRRVSRKYKFLPYRF